MDSDHEQLEELKKWWNENGKSIVAGLAVGLGGVFAWTSWQSWTAAQAERASVRYEQLVNRMAQGDDEGAVAEARALMEEHPDGAYGTLAALVAAHGASGAERVDEAAAHLRWAIENAAYPGIADVARLRLARILLARDDLDDALAQVGAVDEPGLEAIASELEGDIRLAQRDSRAARAAYERALATDSASETTRARVRMKLDDLGRYTRPPAAG